MALVKRDRIALTLDGARIILAAAEARAAEIGIGFAIAVTDSAGMLLALHRMDGAKLTSIDIAINKAFTAAGTRRPTHEYGQIAGAGGPAFGIHASNQGRFTIFGGGVPIIVAGQCIGAVGCSSGTAEQDQEVADAGIGALLAALGAGESD
jgi:uncharacterized protein GlcG (DUF336 family)